ncbi:hypothetical protein DHEL01_v210261 [Diaporthe helianthi]|uniref:Uncharacterized protein n=1 Tax=Diaporthe helianthi TaxID=158607 RepID=A0A2P5HM66_DIAHE|nr:hypothetical protein DHEL01_v210261 [Diaporthe helianthi]
MKRAAFALSSEERALGAGLENNVHPLYRRINFRASALTAEKTRVEEDEQFVKMQVYERMIPAFRLASLLLGFILPFYTKVFCADIIFVGQQYALNPTYECTDTDAQRYSVCRPSVTGRSDRPSHAGGKSQRRAIPNPGSPARSLIGINESTIQFFSQDGYDGVDTGAKTSQIYVQLAFVLVHEQAQAMFNQKYAEDPEMEDDEREFVRRVSPREPMYHMQMSTGAVFSAAVGISCLSSILVRFWRTVQDSPRPGDYCIKTDLTQACMAWTRHREAEFH